MCAFERFHGLFALLHSCTDTAETQGVSLSTDAMIVGNIKCNSRLCESHWFLDHILTIPYCLLSFKYKFVSWMSTKPQSQESNGAENRSAAGAGAAHHASDEELRLEVRRTDTISSELTTLKIRLTIWTQASDVWTVCFALWGHTASISNIIHASISQRLCMCSQPQIIKTCHAITGD